MKEVKNLFSSLNYLIGRSKHSLRAWKTLIFEKIKLMRRCRVRYCVPRDLIKKNEMSKEILKTVVPSLVSSVVSLPFRILTGSTQVLLGLVENRTMARTFRKATYSRVGNYVENNLFYKIIKKRRQDLRRKTWLSGTLMSKALRMNQICDYFWFKKTRVGFSRTPLFSKPFGRLTFSNLRERSFINHLISGSDLHEKEVRKPMVPKWYL